MLAIRIARHGGPETLERVDIDLPPPGPGEATIRHTAIAVNFSDINVRRGGFYQAAPLPMPIIPGNEAAGVVTALGVGVADWRVGDRVGYVGMHGPFYRHTGAYAQSRNVPVDRLVRLPEEIDDRIAAASMMKGMTAASIVERLYRPQRGDVVLVHAAASGVASLLVQWLKHLGAVVIGTVGSPDKAERARALGCDHVILYRDEDFVAATKALTNGVGAHAVFDGVGKDTFVRSMDCTRPFGTLVNYGNASGHVPPIDLIDCALKGSLSVARPGVHFLIEKTQDLRANCGRFFDLLRSGAVRVEIGATYPLADAQQAHRDVEAARVTGSVLLIP